MYMTKSKTDKKSSISHQIREYVGKTGLMELEGMTFEVAITDHSSAYGHDLFTVKPKRGEGEKVVRASRLMFA